MNNQDKRKLHKIMEQMQQSGDAVDLEGYLYVLSANQTGEIGVAGKYNVESNAWVEPMQVFGVEEIAGSNQKYSEKTQQMLEMFKQGSIHFNHLKSLAITIAKDLHEANRYGVASTYYYNFNTHTFAAESAEWGYAKYFRSIMKLYKGKSVD